MEYGDALKRARENLPESVFEKERFEMPKVVGHIEGNKTIISNFRQIASTLRRSADHMLKFVLKEIAAPGDLRHAGLVIGAKVSAARINEKIKQYADEFVFCPVCGKPDTVLVKEGNFLNLKCQACGTTKPVKSKI